MQSCKPWMVLSFFQLKINIVIISLVNTMDIWYFYYFLFVSFLGAMFLLCKCAVCCGSFFIKQQNLSPLSQTRSGTMREFAINEMNKSSCKGHASRVSLAVRNSFPLSATCNKVLPLLFLPSIICCIKLQQKWFVLQGQPLYESLTSQLCHLNQKLIRNCFQKWNSHQHWSIRWYTGNA